MNTPQKILLVQEIIGTPNAIDTDDGQKVYEKLDTALSANEYVLLDFGGVSKMITAFLNSAIGQLYSKYDSSFIDQHVSYSNLSPDGTYKVKLVSDNAIVFFNKG